MDIIESLQWRSAIRQFDTSKKVGVEDLETLLESANLTATSGGLQPFKIVVVSNDDIQSKLLPLSYNQMQVKAASHVLVFAVETNVNEETVDRFIARAAEVRGQGQNELIGYSDSMKAYIKSIPEDQRFIWAKNQAYIALGTVLTAAAALQIDSCPMEGFDAEKYQEILGLTDKNLMPAVILPIGYRSEEDVHSKAKKVRKTRENFVLELN